ncbi:DedA family protein [Streptomyces sp. NPDC096132]|uniref:DedA family protein n=1 Tax=Streptomyces sp. NPDC096132 TaxID=3366075 RepID=UPI0038257199
MGRSSACVRTAGGLNTMNVDALLEAAGWWSYLVVFAVTAAETSAFVGLLVPGEAAILFASALAGHGELNVLLLAAVVVAGGMTGDSLGHALGRRCKRRPNARMARHARPDNRIGRAQAFLLRHGGTAVITGRFIGFVRTFLPFAAGASGMPYRRFLLYSTVASVIWGIGNVLLGYFAGAAVIDLLHSVGLIALAAGAAAVLTVFTVVRIHTRRRRIERTRSTVVAVGAEIRVPAQEPPHMLTYAKEG